MWPVAASTPLLPTILPLSPPLGGTQSIEETPIGPWVMRVVSSAPENNLERDSGPLKNWPFYYSATFSSSAPYIVTGTRGSTLTV